MSKMSNERRAKYEALNREIGIVEHGFVPSQTTEGDDSDRADDDGPQTDPVIEFLNHAMSQGYKMETGCFLQHPGYFQAPHKRSFDDVDIVMLGCPFDMGGVGSARGSRHGPRAVREWSRRHGPVHDSTRRIPYAQCRICDYGDVEWSANEVDACVNDIYNLIMEIGKSGATPLVCGGDHTITFPILKALSQTLDDEPIGVIHLDAHNDSMGPLGTDTYHDGMIFRKGVVDGIIDPERTLQIGIRGRLTHVGGLDFSEASGMTVITADEVWEQGTSRIVDRCKEIIGQGPAYLSLDVDCIDSTEMMGTGGPTTFGLTGRQVRDIIMGVNELNFVGADLVELAPGLDPTQGSSHLAAGLFFELLSLLADTRVRMNGETGPTTWI